MKYVETGLITPPVGPNVFAAKSVAPGGISRVTIFRGVLWFLLADIIVMTCLLGVPEISLWPTDAGFGARP